MDLAQLKQSAEQEATKPEISASQVVYFDKNGKYEQVIADTKEIPDEGIVTVIDEYVGPKGAGYIVRTFINKGKVKYAKAIDYGPEKRSHDWQEIMEQKNAFNR